MIWRRYARGLEQWFADADRAAWEVVAAGLSDERRADHAVWLDRYAPKAGAPCPASPERIFDMIEPTTTGAATYLGRAAEHLVCARLLGWGIWAKVLSGTSAYDIEAKLPGQLGIIRIQVKSKLIELDRQARFEVKRNRTDPVTKAKERVPYDRDDIDIVALVSLPLLGMVFRVPGSTSYSVPLSELTDRFAAKRSFDAAVAAWQQQALETFEKSNGTLENSAEASDAPDGAAENRKAPAIKPKDLDGGRSAPGA